MIFLDWKEVSCKVVNRQHLDAITDIFNIHFPNGTMVYDPESILAHTRGNDWDAHEFSEGILSADVPKVSGYFEKNADFHGRYQKLQEAVHAIDETVVWETQDIVDEDWAESWKEHYHILHYGTRIQVVPEWLEPDIPEDIVIRIEPGMAFGTGEHETTSLCMAWLEELIVPNMTVFDVGTGSGILAIAAQALGADRVDAMDYDDIAVRAAAMNAAKNNATIMSYKSDLLKQCTGKADLIIANIVADVILMLVPQLESHLQEKGQFLCSGVLIERAEEVQKALTDAGFHIKEVREDGPWCAILAEVHVKEGV